MNTYKQIKVVQSSSIAGQNWEVSPQSFIFYFDKRRQEYLLKNVLFY